MDTLQVLQKLLDENKINIQQYRTYKGQISSGNELGCIKGLKRKRLITEADAFILSNKLAYTK
jgi:hypothetical protein